MIEMTETLLLGPHIALTPRTLVEKITSDQWEMPLQASLLKF